MVWACLKRKTQNRFTWFVFYLNYLEIIGMTNPISPEQHRDRPRLIERIRKGTQRFQIAVYLITIVAMAMLINFFMNMFDGGGGGLVSLGPPNEQQVVSQDVVPEKVEDEKKSPTPVVEVLIDNETLLLVRYVNGKQKQSEISLKELVEKAKRATGNRAGIKIRVLRKKSARKLTRTKLRKALDETIGTEAQKWPDALVD